MRENLFLTMEQALLSLINGVPIAAAVMYVWIVSEKNHTDEIKEWRKTVAQKDSYLQEMQKAINQLTAEINKLTFIIENYVITGRTNPTGKQNQRSEERS